MSRADEKTGDARRAARIFCGAVNSAPLRRIRGVTSSGGEVVRNKEDNDRAKRQRALFSCPQSDRKELAHLDALGTKGSKIQNSEKERGGHPGLQGEETAIFQPTKEEVSR